MDNKSMQPVAHYAFNGCMYKLRNDALVEIYRILPEQDSIHGARDIISAKYDGSIIWSQLLWFLDGSFKPSECLDWMQGNQPSDIVEFANPIHQMLYEMGTLDTMPEWVTYVAMEYDNVWTLFEHEPRLTHHGWEPKGKFRYTDEIKIRMPTIEQINELGLTWRKTCIRIR